MGAGASPKYAVKDYDQLQMSFLDVEKLVHLFRKVDKENRNIMTLQSFLNFLHIHPTPFIEKLFSLSENDGVNRISLKMFIFCVWNFCTLLDLNIFLSFIYQMYKKNESGLLDSNDFFVMLREINTKPLTGELSLITAQTTAPSPQPSPDAVLPFEDMNSTILNPSSTSSYYTEILPELVDEVNGSALKLETFKMIMGKYPRLLEPVISFQSRIVYETLGHDAWAQYSSTRPGICACEYNAVATFFRLHLAETEDAEAEHDHNILAKINGASHVVLASAAVAGIQSLYPSRRGSSITVLRKASVAVSTLTSPLPPAQEATMDEVQPFEESASLESAAPGPPAAKDPSTSIDGAVREGQPVDGIAATESVVPGIQPSLTELPNRTNESSQGMLGAVESFFSKQILHTSKPNTAVYIGATNKSGADEGTEAGVTVKRASVKITRTVVSHDNVEFQSPALPSTATKEGTSTMSGEVTVVDFRGTRST